LRSFNVEMNEIFSAVPFTRGQADVEVHKVYRDSFLWVPATGLRNAPEELVLELFREVYFGASRHPIIKERKELGPGVPGLPSAPQAVISALRGRAKKRAGAIRADQVMDFYAPAYPVLAGYAWFRGKTDAALRSLLIEGALAHSLDLTSFDTDAESLARYTVEAIGGISSSVPDLLQVASEHPDSPADLMPVSKAIEELTKTIKSMRPKVAAGTSAKDPDLLARRIEQDWQAICQLEPRIPRAEWIQVLKAFLGLASAIWLLSQMRMTVLARDLVLARASGEDARDESAVLSDFRNRSSSLIEPGMTLSNPTPPRAIEFMRARVELNIYLHVASRVAGDSKILDGRNLALLKGPGALSLLELADAVARKLKGAARSDFSVQLRRVAENVNAWRDPVSSGTTGKNLDEYLRVLTDDRSDSSDNGALLQRARTRSRLYRVFPAPRLLSLFSYLAGVREGRPPSHRIPLSELEAHFGQYGIDFSRVGGARRALIEQLERLGLLRGVPDAGAATEIAVEYSSLWSDNHA